MAASGPFTYAYPRPAVTVDACILRVGPAKVEPSGEGAATAGKAPEPSVLLIQRGGEPFKGDWALPGGFVDAKEGLDTAARRELEEETGATGLALRQFASFGAPGRDPRGHVRPGPAARLGLNPARLPRPPPSPTPVLPARRPFPPPPQTITVAYLCLVDDDIAVEGQDDAVAARWTPLSELPRLAFDHSVVLAAALDEAVEAMGHPSSGPVGVQREALVPAAMRADVPGREAVAAWLGAAAAALRAAQPWPAASA